MKNLILISLLSLAPLAASAGNLVCTSLEEGHPRESNSYVATIASDSKSAELRLPSRGGIPDTVALSCQDVQANVPGNVPHMFLSCVENGADEPGYMLTVSSGGIAGISASLKHESGHGFEPLASLLCHFR